MRLNFLNRLFPIAILSAITHQSVAQFSTLEPDTTFIAEISVTGAPGTRIHIESKDQLLPSSKWNIAHEQTISQDGQLIFDLLPPLPSQRFFRVVSSSEIGSSANGPMTDMLGCRISLKPSISAFRDENTGVRVEWSLALAAKEPWNFLAQFPPDAISAHVIDRTTPHWTSRKYRTLSLPKAPAVTPDDWIWIPPGNFTMGSPDQEADRGWEGPQTLVSITQGYWMSKREITLSQFLAVMGKHTNSWSGSNQPVESVSWHDAVSYCDRLTDIERRANRLPTGFIYRLPTEAEWEYACRAGSASRFSYGDDPEYKRLSDYGWFVGNSDARTQPVGLKKPNAWGLYDMHGNVWEWCLDWYGPLPGGKVTNPQTLTPTFAGLYRTIRGGSLANVGGGCRSGSRNGFGPAHPYYAIGFRPILASVEQ